MQIEEGKFYRTRDGRRVGPMHDTRKGEDPWHGFIDRESSYWYGNGRHYASRRSESDLVAEWADEQPALSTTLAQDGETHVEGAETAADAETPSTDAGNEKDGDPLVNEAVAQAYVMLQYILSEAYDQAAYGKGRVRHANGRPWLEQPIMTIGRDVGLGYPTGQALKKIQEAVGMVSRGEREAAVAELLGAIVYAAAAVQLIREMQSKRSDALSRLAEMDADLIREGE